MIPYYKNNNFSKGLIAGTTAIGKAINNKIDISPIDKLESHVDITTDYSSNTSLLKPSIESRLTILFFALLIIISNIYSFCENNKGKRKKNKELDRKLKFIGVLTGVVLLIIFVINKIPIVTAICLMLISMLFLILFIKLTFTIVICIRNYINNKPINYYPNKNGRVVNVILNIALVISSILFIWIEWLIIFIGIITIILLYLKNMKICYKCSNRNMKKNKTSLGKVRGIETKRIYFTCQECGASYYREYKVQHTSSSSGGSFGSSFGSGGSFGGGSSFRGGGGRSGGGGSSRGF